MYRDIVPCREHQNHLFASIARLHFRSSSGFCHHRTTRGMVSTAVNGVHENDCRANSRNPKVALLADSRKIFPILARRFTHLAFEDNAEVFGMFEAGEVGDL